jgi:hypothetical protein
MPAPRNSPPSPETVAFVRRRYAAGAPVRDILEESALSLGAMYQCIDGLHDDGSGLPLAPLPRRTLIARRRPPLRHVRANLVARLWRAAEIQVNEIEARLKRDDLAADEREGDARVFAIMVRTMRELKALDADAEPPPQPQAVSTSEDDDDPVPRDIDEFRRRLAEKIDQLTAAHSAGAADDAAP